MGMVAGAPFPDVYDWTWGELAEYIKCHDEAEKNSRRIDAAMLFRTAIITAKAMTGTNGQPLDMMNEYSFLWTQAEKDKIKADRLKNYLLQHSKKQ